MKREYVCYKQGKVVKIYGTSNCLLGGVTWRYKGKIFYDKKYGEYMFEPSIFLSDIVEKLVRVIDCEIEKLRKEHGKI